MPDEVYSNSRKLKSFLVRYCAHLYGPEYGVELESRLNIFDLVEDFGITSDIMSVDKALIPATKKHMPTFVLPGTGFSPAGTSPYFSPSEGFGGDGNIPFMPDFNEFIDDQLTAGVSSFNDIISALGFALALGQQASNIFTKDKGSNRNDAGTVYHKPDLSPSSNNVINYEPDKVQVDWNLGIESSMAGTKPNWKPTLYSSCFYATIRELSIPSTDTESMAYFKNDFLPYVKNSINANKKYNAALYDFMDYATFRGYINRIIKAISIYHFFADIYDYTNADIRINNNAGIRYLRNELVQTAQLQRLASLKQLINSFPFPQTLQNSVAQYYGWYSSSEIPFTSIYCNVPPVFVSNSVDPGDDNSGYIFSFKTNVINDAIDMLNFTDLSGDALIKMNKTVAVLSNTIAGWRSSNVGSSYFTDVYDEQHHTCWLNGPSIMSVAGVALDIDIKHPELANSDDYNTPVKYFSKTNVPHGYLDGYMSTITGTVSAHVSNGYQIPMPLATVDRFSHQPLDLTSNVFCYTERATASLIGPAGVSASRGMILLPQSGPESSWLGSSGLPFQCVTDTSVIGSPKMLVSLRQPSDTSLVTNASLNQFLFARNLVLQKWLDIQDFGFNPKSDGKDSKFDKRPGRGGRGGKSPVTDDKEMIEKMS